MPLDIDSPDYFALGLTNYADDGYQKNGTVKIGGYERTAYCWESLFRPDLAGVPVGSTITAVTIEVVLNNDGAGGPFTLQVHEQDKGSWADSSPEPSWGENPNNDSTAAWPTALSSVSAARNGTRTIPTSANLVDWLQDVLDGVTTNNGLVLSWYSSYYDWLCAVTGVTVNITYTAPAGYGNKVHGIDSADIGKINGVDTEDIDKVNGA